MKKINKVLIKQLKTNVKFTFILRIFSFFIKFKNFVFSSHNFFCLHAMFNSFFLFTLKEDLNDKNIKKVAATNFSKNFVE